MLDGLLSLYLGAIVLAVLVVPVALVVKKAFETDGWQRSVTGLAAFAAVILVGSAIYSGISESFSEDRIWGYAQIAAVALLFWIGRTWLEHKDEHRKNRDAG